MQRFIIFIISFLIITTTTFAQRNKQVTDSQLASEYYRSKEFDKAAVLYEKLFNTSNSKVYFNYYLKCLTALNEYKDAEKIVKKQIKRHPDDLSYQVDLGYIYKEQDKKDKADKVFNDAIDEMSSSVFAIKQLANAFVMKREYSYAEKTYLKGREKLGGRESFNYELANVYTMQRNHKKMIESYLAVLEEDESQLKSIQNRMQHYVFGEMNEELKEILRTELLKRIQTNPETIVFNEMLIWLYIQEKKFKMAFMQTKALDRRLGENGMRVIELARLAASNTEYDIAIDAYQYVVDMGDRTPHYVLSKLEMLDVLYEKVVNSPKIAPHEIEDLEKQYLTTVEELGKNKTTINLLKDLAHLQAFYLNKIDEARLLIETAIELPGLSRSLLSACQLEYGDILLLSNDIWDATLVYAKVEKDNEQNPTGHEAKFRKAKLAYYAGNFQWAQAQLDVLKASTSKLIANNALELSLLINDNTIVDGNDSALIMYANAQLLVLQNKDSLAMLTLDSISSRFKTHSLNDEILFTKAMIMKKRGKYEQAIEYLQKVVQNYSWDILADNALYEMATIYDKQLDDEEKAKENYKQLLLKYPGSIYTVEARKRFRELRGDLKETDDKFFKEIKG